MFIHKKQSIEKIHKLDPKGFNDFLSFLENKKTSVYIDHANIREYSQKTKWHIDIKRMKDFFDSFDVLDKIYFYSGVLVGDINSENEKEKIEGLGYMLRSKEVKIKKISIDVSSLQNLSDKSILDNFVRKSLLRKFSIENIEYNNTILSNLNKTGELYIEDRKCNFDAEMVYDITSDLIKKESIEVFILMTSDSDFVDIVKILLQENKKVMLISTSRKVAKEYQDIHSSNFYIFEINKLRNYFCRNREINLRQRRGE